MFINKKSINHLIAKDFWYINPIFNFDSVKVICKLPSTLVVDFLETFYIYKNYKNVEIH